MHARVYDVDSILGDLPSFSQVLSLNPPGAHRQGLPDPHYARPALDGERTGGRPGSSGFIWCIYLIQSTT